jgi:hypothetical protein
MLCRWVRGGVRRTRKASSRFPAGIPSGCPIFIGDWIECGCESELYKQLESVSGPCPGLEAGLVGWTNSIRIGMKCLILGVIESLNWRLVVRGTIARSQIGGSATKALEATDYYPPHPRIIAFAQIYRLHTLPLYHTRESPPLCISSGNGPYRITLQ